MQGEISEDSGACRGISKRSIMVLAIRQYLPCLSRVNKEVRLAFPLLRVLVDYEAQY
jgi:hypothetical protein